MQIVGAVLEQTGAAPPFADSAPLTVGPVELDGPGPREVLVRIEAAGICHSDLSVVEGNRPRPTPMLLGHEAAGAVVECGSEVTDLVAGARVVLTFMPRCGSCTGCGSNGVRPCLPGSAANEAGTLMDGERRLHREGSLVHHHLGVSAFATHAVVDRRSVVPVAADVPAVEAALLGCAVLTGGGAVINSGRVLRGQRVAVVGLGGVGLAALLTALALEDIDVVGVDMLDSKLAYARELGMPAYRPDEAVAKGIRADVVIEAAGSARAFETAIEMTGPGGRMVTVGLPPATALASVSPLALVAGGRSIVGSYLGSAVPERDIPVFVDLWRRGRLPLRQLVSSTIDLEEINGAMDRLARGAELRQMIEL